MTRITLFSLFLILICLSSFVYADDQISTASSNDIARDMLIQKELDCVAQSQKDKVAWGDLCQTKEPEHEYEPPPPTKAAYPITSSTASLIAYPREKHHSLSIAYETFFDKYSKYKREESTGLWSGISGTYIYRPPQGNILNNPIFNFYSLEGIYASGKNNRSGEKDPDFLVVKNIPGAMYEARALVGRDLNVSNNVLLTPYVGYGVRYKTTKAQGHEDILSDTSHVWGYKQEQLSYYIPAGLTTNLKIHQDYEVTFNIEYDFFLKGIEKNHYSNANDYASTYNEFPVFFDDIRVTQRGGYGLRSSLKLLKHFSAVDVYLEPFVRYWNIKASKTGDGDIKGDPGLSGTVSVLQTQTIRDDKNYTLESGIKTGIQF